MSDYLVAFNVALACWNVALCATILWLNSQSRSTMNAWHNRLDEWQRELENVA